jgi:hypothetical protein
MPAPADVSKDRDAGKVVGVGHRRRFPSMHSDHRRIKNRGLVGILGQEIENRHSVQFVEGGFPGLHTVKQFAPGPIMLLPAHDCQGTLRTGYVTSQTFSQRCQGKSALAVVRENADARQSTEQAVQRGGVGFCGLAKIVHRTGANLQQVSDAQLGSDVKCLGNPVAGEHLVHSFLRRLRLHLSILS